MAFVIQGSGAQAPKMYNVEQAVGDKSPNASGDVKLVQYMLRHHYGSAASNLATDGWIGPITINWIRKFQQDMASSGAKVLVDGRIDRAFGQVSSVSKTVYTIILLNQALQKRNPAAFSSIPSQVPLNAKPKANPYNAAKKPIKVVMAYSVGGVSPPYQVYVVYQDDSVDTMRVEGNLSFPPGTPVAYFPII